MTVVKSNHNVASILQVHGLIVHCGVTVQGCRGGQIVLMKAERVLFTKHSCRFTRLTNALCWFSALLPFTGHWGYDYAFPFKQKRFELEIVAVCLERSQNNYNLNIETIKTGSELAEYTLTRKLAKNGTLTRVLQQNYTFSGHRIPVKLTQNWDGSVLPEIQVNLILEYS